MDNNNSVALALEQPNRTGPEQKVLHNALLFIIRGSTANKTQDLAKEWAHCEFDELIHSLLDVVRERMTLLCCTDSTIQFPVIVVVKSNPNKNIQYKSINQPTHMLKTVYFLTDY